MRVIKIIYLFMFLLFVGCSFDASKIVMSEYKLKNGSIIQLVHYNNGATAPMGIQIKKKNSDFIIDDLEGFAETYTADFNQINDTLLKITLTDTAFFKGKQIPIMVNLSKRVNRK